MKKELDIKGIMAEVVKPDYFKSREQVVNLARTKIAMEKAETNKLEDPSKLTKYMLREMFLKELSGAYNIKTAEKVIKKNEDIFWRELIMMGSVVIYKVLGEVRLYRNVLAIYDADGNLASLQGTKLFSLYATYTEQGLVEELDVDFAVVFRLRPISSPQSFYFWYNWALNDILTTYKNFIASINYSAKTNLIKFKGEDKRIYNKLIDSLKDSNNPFLALFNVEGDLADGVSDGDFTIEPIELTGTSITIDEVNKIWNSIRDKLGMRSNSNTKAERMLLDEVAEGNVNTDLNENVDIRTLIISCEDLKEKLNIIIEIEKTIDIIKEENSEDKEKGTNETNKNKRV